MRETNVEKRLRSRVCGLGGLAPKWVSPGNNGVPDRILLFPGGRVIFCETKAPGKKLEPLQEYRKKQLESLGFTVWVADTPEAVDELIRKEEENAAAQIPGARQATDR